ncbi:MAG: hypothetical protein PUF03_08030 [Lachnospiraceae bacterium]|nr:hypothetical protein [Lachnospiraceae bacterium]
MDLLLSEYNKNKRNDQRIIGKDCIIRKRGELLHVCFNSPGCRFRSAGSCTMCDYGQGKVITEQNVKSVLPEIQNAAIGIKSILIGTLGSVLDTTEISKECLKLICEFVNDMVVETVIFETHYSLIDDDICQWLRQHLPTKDIVVEVGIESADQFVQDKCLNKRIDMEVLKSKIQLLHHYGMSITANIFLGAPFLSVAEQVDDAEKTVNWAINNEIDSVVIFPANIRKNTLLYELYKNGKYMPIQHWAIFELLCRIPVFYLNKIYLAWYGDWIDVDDTGEAFNLPPCACKICEPQWFKFYHAFLAEPESLKRKQMLHIYRNEMAFDCNCYNRFENSMKLSLTGSREYRVEKERQWIVERLTLDNTQRRQK